LTGTVYVAIKPTTPTSKKSNGTPRNGERNALTPRSEGHRLLIAVGDSRAAVARAAGSAKTSAHRWLSGFGLPEPDARKKLRQAYGIPIEAWEQAPRSPEREHREPETEAEPEVDAPANSAAHFLELIRDIRRIKRELSPSEQLKAIKDEGALRSLYERALSQTAREWDRTIRESPQWQRFEDAIVRALSDFPEARAAVLDALERMGP
jgi:hypothetical protein